MSLCDLFARKHLKLSRKLTGGGPAAGSEAKEQQQEAEVQAEVQAMMQAEVQAEVQAEEPAARSSSPTAPPTASRRPTRAPRGASDGCRLPPHLLEAINLCLTAGPALNEHLVYAMLERQSIFAPLRSHELFSDLVENIDVVLEHFGATLRTHPDSSDAGGDSVWSVDAVLSHIRAAARDWRADRMRPLQDLRFTYEQEPSPEGFFTPYLWSVVFNSSELGWNADTVLLFNADDGGAPLLDAVDSDGVTGEGLPLPALSSIDVADAESGQGARERAGVREVHAERTQTERRAHGSQR